MHSLKYLPGPGQILVAANERAARAIALEHGHIQQLTRSAWLAPQIFSWDAFLLGEWQLRESEPLTLLTPWQERELWTQIIQNSGIPESAIAKGLAPLAQSAYSLLCDFSPGSLSRQSRADWIGDAKSFSLWLDTFSTQCNKNQWLPSAQLAQRLTELLKSSATSRAPLQLLGFDRITHSRKLFLEAWGEYSPVAPGLRATQVEHRSYLDPTAELAACAQWLELQLKQGATRIALLMPQTDAARGQIERVLRAQLALPQLQLSSGNQRLPFEFTEGIPLAQIPFIQAALLFLQWLQAPLPEAEVFWLLQSGYLLSSEQERIVIAEADLQHRRKGKQRTEWSLLTFAEQVLPSESALRHRLQSATALLPAANRIELPIHWAALLPRLLEAAGFPGGQPLTSGEKQASDRWSTLLDESAALGATTARIPLQRYLAHLSDQTNQVLFTQQSEGAAIQIMEPVAAAGQQFDALWFLNASETTWPARGNPNPMLPRQLQRDCQMPNSSASANWELAQQVTTRIAASANTVVFSYPIVNDDGDQRPSSLVLGFAGPAIASLPQPDLTKHSAPALEEHIESKWIPLATKQAEGGSAVLTDQSNCAFLAFANHRLGAKELEDAQTGLTPAERGQLLHKVLEALWNPTHGPFPDGSRSLQILEEELKQYIDHAIAQVFAEHRAIHPNQPWEHRYLQLERERIASLVLDWLRFERTRPAFIVESTEHNSASVKVGPLEIDLRLDRVDLIGPEDNQSRLLIDYKTGDVSPRDWSPPRPKDPQLPLYATFTEIENLSGLVFAKLRRETKAFTMVGNVRSAAEVIPNPDNRNALVKKPLTDALLDEWQTEILSLADNFASGVATVNPRKYPETCKYCSLGSLCRVQELNGAAGDEEKTEEADDDE